MVVMTAFHSVAEKEQHSAVRWELHWVERWVVVSVSKRAEKKESYLVDWME